MSSLPAPPVLGRAHPLVLLTTDFRPLVGGIAELLHQLANAEASRTTVAVYSSVDRGDARWPHRYEWRSLPPPPTRRLGARIGEGIPPIRKAWTAVYYAALRRAGTRVVRRVLAESAPDAEVCIGHWNLESDAWCRALEISGRPYSLLAYGLEIATPYSERVEIRRREAFLRAARVYAISRGTMTLLRQRLGCSGNVRQIRLGVESADVDAVTEAESGALRATLGVSDAFVLLTVGRLVRRKGVDLVLSAVARLGDELPGIRYVVAGEGPELAALRAHASQLGLADRVRFLGRVDDATRARLYAACDAFVMPNRLLGDTDFEGFGLVFLEAGLAGKPVIGGDNGGVPDAVVHDITGLLVDPEIPLALESAIRRLATDPALARRLGHAGRTRARRDHSPQAVAEAFAAARDGVEASRV